MKAGAHFFLVDDDVDDQEIFQIVLNEIDPAASLHVADNGVEALQILDSDGIKNPDYILIDVNMPKMNGLECLQRIRAMGKFKSSTIVMYSTTSEKKVVSESMELGADHFLMKQAATDDLKKKLLEIL